MAGRYPLSIERTFYPVKNLYNMDGETIFFSFFLFISCLFIRPVFPTLEIFNTREINRIDVCSSSDSFGMQLQSGSRNTIG